MLLTCSCHATCLTPEIMKRESCSKPSPSPLHQNTRIGCYEGTLIQSSTRSGRESADPLALREMVQKDAHLVLRTSATFADHTPRQLVRAVKHRCTLPVFRACSGLWCTTCNAPQAQINKSWRLLHANTTQAYPLNYQPGRAGSTLVQRRIQHHLLPCTTCIAPVAQLDACQAVQQANFLQPSSVERMSDKPARAYPRSRRRPDGQRRRTAGELAARWTANWPVLILRCHGKVLERR